LHAAVLAATLLYASTSAGAALRFIRVELDVLSVPSIGDSTPTAISQPVAPAIANDDLGAAGPSASGSVDQPSSTPNTAAPLLATRTYTVEDGDNVRSIAKQFGVSNETVIWENDLTDPDNLAVGQKLEILPFTGLVHQVRPGDTVASIANFYDARVEDVIGVNRLTDPEVIVVGRKLAVPGGYRPLPAKPVAGSDDATPSVEAKSTDQAAARVGSPRKILPVLGNTPQEQFISVIAPAAVKSAEDTGVPASVTIAQAIIESYWGSSRLSTDANNYFGIKGDNRPGTAGVVWFNTWEVLGGRNVMTSAPFRAYKSLADSFEDHGRFFLDNPRYAPALAVEGDARKFAQAIARSGYATDPGYAGKLIQLMDRYNLYRYD
jgi:flagellum-specific peptidoglycan hydrolase FlgJ